MYQGNLQRFEKNKKRMVAGVIYLIFGRLGFELEKDLFKVLGYQVMILCRKMSYSYQEWVYRILVGLSKRLIDIDFFSYCIYCI